MMPAHVEPPGELELFLKEQGFTIDTKALAAELSPTDHGRQGTGMTASPRQRTSPRARNIHTDLPQDTPRERDAAHASSRRGRPSSHLPFPPSLTEGSGRSRTKARPIEPFTAVDVPDAPAAQQGATPPQQRHFLGQDIVLPHVGRSPTTGDAFAPTTSISSSASGSAANSPLLSSMSPSASPVLPQHASKNQTAQRSPRSLEVQPPIPSLRARAKTSVVPPGEEPAAPLLGRRAKSSVDSTVGACSVAQRQTFAWKSPIAQEEAIEEKTQEPSSRLRSLSDRRSLSRFLEENLALLRAEAQTQAADAHPDVQRAPHDAQLTAAPPAEPSAPPSLDVPTQATTGTPRRDPVVISPRSDAEMDAARLRRRRGSVSLQSKLLGTSVVQLFATIDANGNGSIELSEVLDFFGGMGSPEGDELSRLFAKMDTSGSGALDLVQFSALIKEFGVRMGLRDALETKDTPAGASALISPRGPETTSRRPRRSSNPDVFAVSRRPSLADVSALQRTSRLTRETECVLGGTY